MVPAMMNSSSRAAYVILQCVPAYLLDYHMIFELRYSFRGLVVGYFIFSIVAVSANQYLFELVVVYQSINDPITFCSWKFMRFNRVDCFKLRYVLDSVSD
jgi:hypothetical protein